MQTQRFASFSVCANLQPFITLSCEELPAFLHGTFWFLYHHGGFLVNNSRLQNQYTNALQVLIQHIALNIASKFQVHMTSNKKVIKL